MDKTLLVIAGRDCLPAKMVLGAGEVLRLTLVVPPGVSCDLPFQVDLDGPGAELDLAGLWMSMGCERVRVAPTVRHNAGGATSHQLFKGLAGGTAHTSFEGLIQVQRDAQKTEATQQNHNLLLSKTCEAQTRPQLEIYADDVVCSHGATTGFLNADEQFYMRSRGIPEAEARRLQILSFLSPILSRLPQELSEELSGAL